MLSYDNFINFCNSIGCKIFKNELLSKHTTFKIGGIADVLIKPDSLEKIKKSICYLKQNNIPHFILGKGSNTLFSDDGYRGVIINLDSDFSSIKLVGNDIIEADAGVTLTELCKFAQKHSLSGLEFAYGIPGTLGGAIYMNAGAYGGEIKDVLVSSQHIDDRNELSSFSIDDLNMSYRHSKYSENNFCIVSAKIKLVSCDADLIQNKMNETLQKRRDKQPLEYPSAGSTFKRPEGTFAALLIEQCGLKGFSIGGAQVSEKHSGFVINKGGATSADVVALISYIKDVVYKQTGYNLECEVLMI